MPTIRRSHGQIGTVEHAEHSDAPFSSDELDEVFDVDKADDGSNADASIGDFDETDGLIELDVEDQLKLFEGNTHPPEYYRQAVVTFNASDYESEDYALGTTRYLDGIEEQWIWWDTPNASCCPFPMLIYSIGSVKISSDAVPKNAMKPSPWSFYIPTSTGH